MAINHRYFEHKEARIEVVPMIDIMMFLLIFFMLIMLKMIEASGIPLKLPQSSTQEKMQAEPVKRTISIPKDSTGGTFILEKDKLDGPAITARLKELKASNREVQVVIATDKDVPYQRFVEAMDVVRAAGIDGIGVATIANGASSSTSGGAAQ